MSLEKRYLQRSRATILGAAVLGLVITFAIAPTFVKTTTAQPASKERPLTYSLADVLGRPHTAQEVSKSKAAVFLFVAAECPISNRYAPEINRIVADYRAQSFVFYGVHSDPDLEREAARKHASEYGFQFPVLLDPLQTLAATFGVTLTPTVVVASPSGDLIYRGRIDNRYLDFGRYRNAGIASDLRLVLDAVSAGRVVTVPFTKSIGCAIPQAHKRGPAGVSASRAQMNHGE